MKIKFVQYAALTEVSRKVSQETKEVQDSFDETALRSVRLSSGRSTGAQPKRASSQPRAVGKAVA